MHFLETGGGLLGAWVPSPFARIHGLLFAVMAADGDGLLVSLDQGRER